MDMMSPTPYIPEGLLAVILVLIFAVGIIIQNKVYNDSKGR
jgi:hypothetical protein